MPRFQGIPVEDEVKPRFSGIPVEEGEPEEKPSALKSAAQNFATGATGVIDLAQIVGTMGRSLVLPEEERWGHSARQALYNAGFGREPGTEPQGVLNRAADFLGSGAIPVAGLAGRGASLLRGGAKEATGLIDRMALSAAQRPGLTATTEVLGATGAAAGGSLVHNEDPDANIAQLVAEVVGGLAAPATLSGPTVKLGSLAAGQAKKAFSGVRGAGASDRAAKRLQDAAGPGGAGRLEGPTIGELTPGMRLGSPEMRGIETFVESIDPKYAARSAADKEATLQRLEAMPAEGLAGELADVRKALINRRRAIVGRRVQEEGRLAGVARQKTEALGDPDDLRQIGVRTKEKLKADLGRMKTAEDAAWAAVNKDAPVNYSNTVGAYDNFVGTLGKDVNRAEIIPPWLAERIKEYGGGKPRTVKDLIGFRSSILDDLRAEAAKDASNGNKMRLLKDMQTALLDDLAASGVAGTKEAREISSALNQTYRQGPVGRALGYERTGEAAVPPDATMRSFFSGSREEVAANIDMLERASPEAMKEVESFMRTEFLNTVFENGKPVPAAAKAFVGNKKNAEVLKKFPGLRDQISDAGEAQRLYERSRAMRENVSQALLNKNKSVMALYLDADPGMETMAAMKSQKPFQAMRGIYARVSKDKRAVDGLHAEVLQNILEDGKVDGVLRASALRKSIAKHSAAAQGAGISQERRARLGAVLGELQKFETEVGEKAILNDLPHNILRRIFRMMGAKATRALPMRGDIQTPGAAASIAQEKGLEWLRSVDKADQAVVAAIMDERVLREMLQRKISKPGRPAQFRQLRGWLVGVGGDDEPSENAK